MGRGMTQQNYILKELAFYVVVSDQFPEGEEPSSVSFKVYEITSVDSDTRELLFDSNKKGESVTTKIEDAVEYFSGFVKWDGCSNWDIGDQHFCNVTQAERMGPLLRCLYKIAAEWMPNHCEDILYEVKNFGWMFDEAEA